MVSEFRGWRDTEIWSLNLESGNPSATNAETAGDRCDGESCVESIPMILVGFLIAHRKDVDFPFLSRRSQIPRRSLNNASTIDLQRARHSTNQGWRPIEGYQSSNELIIRILSRGS